MQTLEQIVRWRKMNTCKKFLLIVISLLITFSLVHDGFADDHGYRNRYRHRRGSAKIEDNGAHDNNGHLKPATNPQYREICGGCHFAYQPELLPSGSWLRILERPDDHFGEKIEIDAAGIKTLWLYLQANAAETSSAGESMKIMRCLKNQLPARITEIPYIRKKHRELDPAVFNRKSIGSFSNCVACHTTAESGVYDDDEVKIPD